MTTSRKLKAEMELGVALIMVAFTVVDDVNRPILDPERLEMIENRKRLLLRKKNRLRPGVRSNRRFFNHQRAYDCIQFDHLGEAALFGSVFVTYFRLSRARIQVLLETFGNSGDPYYSSSTPI